MKMCSCCKTEMEESLFNKNKSSPDGLAYECKECCRKRHLIYYNTYKEKILKEKKKKYWEDPEKYRLNKRNSTNKIKNNEKAKEWYKNNKDKKQAYDKEYSSKRIEERREASKKFRNRHPNRKRYDTAKRRADLFKRTVGWANMEEIKKFYDNCPEGRV